MSITYTLPPASPPPAPWRAKVPRAFSGEDWRVSWREAQSETANDAYLYRTVHKWVGILTGAPSSSQYWVDGTLPSKQVVDRQQHPMEMLSCPGHLRMKSHHAETQPQCNAWWPRKRSHNATHGGHACVAYILGLGEIRDGGWEFAHRAAKHGCIVHGYEPAKPLRAGHERYARQNNFSFHFAGLSGARSFSSLTSYGVAEGDVLATLDQLAERNPPGERQPDVLSIDVEGYEWTALDEMARNPHAMRLLAGVRVFYLDLHFHLRNPPTLREFVHAFEFLFDRMQFRLAWLRNGNGYPADQKVVDYLGVAGLPAGLCCYEMALVRTPSHTNRTRAGWRGV